jgi:hypothetical protein
MAATTTAPNKTVSYMDQLNKIAMAETNAGRYLEAWADVTPDPELACALRLVAARETSHGEVFRRRIAELGGEVCCMPDPSAMARLAVVSNPAISDLEKIGPARDETDPFGPITRRIAEGEYDAMTCNLMTWYIAEERDTIGRLRNAFATVRAKANGACMTGDCAEPSGPSADAQAIMSCMTDGFARLEKSFEKLVRAVK